MKKERDLIGALSSLSGLSPDEIRQAWKDAKRNSDLLDSCKGPHIFCKADDRRMICASCGGIVSASDARWYEFGLAHGRRDTGPKPPAE